MGKRPTYEELEQRVDGLEKKARERARLDDRMQLLSLAAEQSSEAIAVVDLDGNLEYLNVAFARMYGYSVKELIGKNLSIFHTPQQMPSVEAANKQLKKTGSFKGEIWHVTRNGTEFSVLMHNSLLRDDTGNPIGIIGTLCDITDLKAKEAEIKASEVRFRELFNYMSSGVAVYEAKDNGNDFIFKDFNRAGERIENIKKESLLGKSILEMFPGVKEIGLFDVFKRVWETGKSEHHPVSLYKDERITGWKENYIYKLPSGEIVAVYDDITDHKLAEDALRESEKKYRLLVNNIPGTVYKGYKDWSVDFFDDKIELLTGYAADEYNSRKIKWTDIIVEEDIEAARKIFIQALKTDKSYIREYRIISKTGDILWIEERGQIICNQKGEIEYVSGIYFDISGRKQMQEELLKAKKLESVGILAGGIAHDFNNLLTIIIGNIELAEDDIKPEVGVSKRLEEAEKACIQAQALSNQLITFSKGGAPVKKIGSIGNLVKETIAYSLSGSNVKCGFLISHDLWPVKFDQDQMKHAINNIIDNAVESMPDEGTIHVRAENFYITAEQGLPLLEGKYVKISIRDHGVGIHEKHFLQIFDPYFSLKDMGIQKGMGLGLATTYSIINRHDGYITVESEVGVGTTFTLFLPAQEKDIRKLEPVKILEAEKPKIRTGRILLMDDEESIRKVLKKRLSVLGYESELAKDGAQAIELYKKAMDSRQPFDLVILDLTVKRGMGGKYAVKALLKINPQVKAIVSSGYSNDPVITNFRAYGFTGTLPKPNTKKELIAALKNITKE